MDDAAPGELCKRYSSIAMVSPRRYQATGAGQSPTPELPSNPSQGILTRPEE